jgi:hypothetical protein
VLDAFRELIDELIAAPKVLRDAGFAQSTNPQAISALGLLAARDSAVHERIQTVIRQETPLLAAPPESIDATGLDAENTLAAFDTGRGELVSLLMNLTLKDWERIGIDWTGHERSVADDVEEHVEYDEEIVATITDQIAAA